MDFYLRNGEAVGLRSINGFPLKAVCDYRRDWLTDKEVSLMVAIDRLIKIAKIDYAQNSQILEFVQNMNPHTELTTNRLSKLLAKLMKRSGLLEAKYRDASGTIEGYRLTKYGTAIVIAEYEGIYSNPERAYTKKWTGYNDDDRPKFDTIG